MCHWCFFRLRNPSVLAAAFEFEQDIVPIICFLVICFLSCLRKRYWFGLCQRHMCHRFCLLCIYGVLAALNRSLFRFYYIWQFFLTRHWFVQCQQHFNIGVILQYNSDSMVAEYEQVTISIHLLFTWVLCIYIILDKGCHI